MKDILIVCKKPIGLLGFFLVLFWVIIALLAPMLAPPENSNDKYMMPRHSFSSLPSPPEKGKRLGATSGGYDIFYGIIWGSRTALFAGLVTVVSTAFIGTFIGGIGAYKGGFVDECIMRIVDLLMGFPFIIGVIVMTTVLGKGLDKVILVLILIGWRDYARIMRSEVLSVKEKEYIKAAEALGVTPLGIFIKHIVPNSINPIIVMATQNIGRITLVIASLSFIGVGSEPGFADWGQMLNFAQNWVFGSVGNPFLYWYTYTYPALAIISFVLGWTLIGDTLRDLFDPQYSLLKKKTTS